MNVQTIGNARAIDNALAHCHKFDLLLGFGASVKPDGFLALRMLEIGLTGVRRRKIAVETHAGTPIDNYIAAPPNQQDINKYYGVLRPVHGRAWLNRKGACGVYNCAGMVWASRRTSLTEPHDWELILTEDGYRKLESEEEADVGEVVVYRSRQHRGIMHVARICKKDRLACTEGATPVLWALSKWDQTCGEDIHALADVYLEGGDPFTIEIWTDRPHGHDPRIEAIQRLHYPQ